jgi:hypothetical protein
VIVAGTNRATASRRASHTRDPGSSPSAIRNRNDGTSGGAAVLREAGIGANLISYRARRRS